MSRRPIVIDAQKSKHFGDPCITVGWDRGFDFPDPGWVGYAVGTTEDAAFASLAANSAMRAQPASGDLLRAVLGELVRLTEQTVLCLERYARRSEDDAVRFYDWENKHPDYHADEMRANRLAQAAMCRQTAQLLRELNK